MFLCKVLEIFIMFHPLCGYSLQKGTRIFAIFDLALCIAFTLMQIAFLHLGKHDDDEWEPDSEAKSGLNATITENEISIVKTDEGTWEEYMALVVTSYIVFVIYVLVEVWLYRLLIRASNNRDLPSTKRWFLVRFVITLVILNLNILSFALLGFSGAEFSLELLTFLYRIYELKRAGATPLNKKHNKRIKCKILNPLCGYSLQKGSRFIAFIDLILGTIVVAYLVVGLIHGYNDSKPDEHDGVSSVTSNNGTETDGNKSVNDYIIKKWDRIIIILLYIAAECWLFFKLMKATKHLNTDACRIWIRFRSLVLLLTTVFFLFKLITGRYETLELILECILIIYRMYEIDVVFVFRREIEDARQTQALSEQTPETA
ncbi:hypothetical protein Ocin01_15104 [Orchesella cincta]|uniref:Uncharacterized protein n=1 Tax=Orchesella cincta TaxID=48709 RepID=A0A1D2MF00_ORCCI|nr:hypothetical protein Ocin01_15104 [Orchesella cincta]